MKVRKIALTFFICSLYMSAYSFAETEASHSVRLPSITHVWGPDDVTDKPVITIEQIEKCMGVNSKMSQDFESFNVEADALNKESLTLDPLVKSLALERESIEAEAKALQAETAILNNDSQELEKQRTLIDGYKGARLTEAEAKKINVLINTYNSQVSQHNASSNLLRAKVSLFQDRQQKFNAGLQPIKEKFDAFNAKANSFKIRKSEFDLTLNAFREKCEGPHRIDR